MGLFGPPDVKKLKKNNNVKGLIKALSYQDNIEVREQAAEALGKIGGAAAIQPLAAALKDDRGVCRRAIASLGNIDDPVAARHLVNLLVKNCARDRNEVIKAIFNLGNTAVEPLIEALCNDSEYLRIGAAMLGKIGDKRAVEPLINTMLRTKDQLARSEAAKALGFLKDPEAVEPLISALRDDWRGVRCNAVRALGIIGNKRAVEPLMERLQDADWHVRSSTAWVLGNFGDITAVEPLCEALKDNHDDVRRNVAEALGKIGSDNAVIPLIEALEDEDSDVRKVVTESLRKIGTIKALKAVKEFEESQQSFITTS